MTDQDENLDDIIASLIDVDEEETAEKDNSPVLTEKTELTGEPVTLTERAANQVREIIKREDLGSDLFLRVAVEGGGCSGLSYKLGLDYKTEEDNIFENHGVEVIVAPKHLMYLEGIEIDYPDGLDARGFTFDNPNSVEDCGCGTSFAI